MRASSRSNVVCSNEFKNNSTYGVYAEEYWAKCNTFYHNNFVDNASNALDRYYNYWDNSYIGEGNYWSDFDEPSEGAFDDDGDGIVDSSYLVPPGNNEDNYPLISPWDITELTLVCGDCNDDGTVHLEDVVYLLNYLFKKGPSPLPMFCAADCDGNESTDVGDVIFLLNYLFGQGSAPDGCCEWALP